MTDTNVDVVDDDATEWREDEWRSLIEAIKSGECTPFLGAGACAGTLPTGRTIAREWAEKYGYPFADKDNLPRVAQFVAMDGRGLGSITPKVEIRKRFKEAGLPNFTREDEPHRVVADLNLPLYITTNYDNFMVRAIERDGRRIPVRETCQWKGTTPARRTGARPRLIGEPTPERPLVFHLHGTLDESDTMVLTEDDYLDFLASIAHTPRLIPAYVEAKLSNSSSLFLGYSLNDLNFKVLFRRVAWYMQRSEGARHVSVQLAPQPVSRAGDEREMLLRQRKYLENLFQQQRVKIYWGSCSKFAAELGARWRAYNG